MSTKPVALYQEPLDIKKNTRASALATALNPVASGSADTAEKLADAPKPKKLIRKLVERLEEFKQADQLGEDFSQIITAVKEVLGHEGDYPLRLPLYKEFERDLTDLNLDHEGIRINNDTGRQEPDLVIDDILSPTNLQALGKKLRSEILDALEKNFRASLFASDYKPVKKSVHYDGEEGEKKYRVFNDFFEPQAKFDLAKLEALQSDLTEKSLFNFATIPELGLIRTSVTENKDMNWQWGVDSMMAGYYQRAAKPADWRKSLITNAAVYNARENVRRMDDVIHEPASYREQGLDSEEFVRRGVTHIFKPFNIEKDSRGVINPESFELGTWASPKRIESHALMLKNLLAAVKHHKESNQAEAWGFDPKAELQARNREQVFGTIANLSQYLLAANYNPKTKNYDLQAPTNSSWEEICFWEGTSSDIALVTLALEELDDILFNPQYENDELIMSLRTSMGLALDGIPEHAWYSHSGKLKELIAKGRSLVNFAIVTQIESGKEPYQVENRKSDTSLVLLAASDYVFDKEDPYHDATIRYELVRRMFEDLQGEHGMRRFNEFDYSEASDSMKVHDNYLSLNYQAAQKLTPIAQVKAGEEPSFVGMTKDSGSLDDYRLRQRFSLPQHAAQWTIGPTAAIQALAKVKESLLDSIAQDRKPKKSKKLLKEVNKALSHAINLTVSHIAGGKWGKSENLVRADGAYLPDGYSMMEAYQAVTDLEGKVKWLPGENTLNWSAVQLYDGLNKATDAETRAASMSLAA